VLKTDGSFKMSGDLTIGGAIITEPSKVQILTTAVQIVPSSAKIRIVGSETETIIQSIPEITAGKDGQALIIQGTSDTAPVVLQSESVSAGSGLKLGSDTRVIGKGDILTLTYDQADGIWYEVSYSNN
jgi:hypothetical protein